MACCINLIHCIKAVVCKGLLHEVTLDKLADLVDAVSGAAIVIQSAADLVCVVVQACRVSCRTRFGLPLGTYMLSSCHRAHKYAMLMLTAQLPPWYIQTQARLQLSPRLYTLKAREQCCQFTHQLCGPLRRVQSHAVVHRCRSQHPSTCLLQRNVACRLDTRPLSQTTKSPC